MSGTDLHQLLGAYLLGGLEPAEGKLFEQHLTGCQTCRRELDELASLPALLDALPVADAVALADSAAQPEAAPSEPGPGALLAELSARRRASRRRWMALVGAVAAAFLALGVLAAPLMNQPPRPDASYSVQAAGGMQVQLDLLKKAWGTEVSFTGTSLPTRGTLSLWVRTADGGEDRACSWAATPAGKSRVTGATPAQISRITKVELRDEAQQTVAVISMVGGSS
ncbi:zf-HC2 domain-containing protein [Arthrobacter sp. 92]|jgi:hypothetical protein|uniref:zf-HC2 domain-containing protein n=1 Tax=Arthrobacter sp. 92 TaxID=3418175 RepID=UPI003D007405